MIAPALPSESTAPEADVVILHVVGAAIVRGGRCLVARRGPAMRLAGKWELPGGKIEAGEDPRRALEREIHEELDLAIVSGELLGRGRARDAHREIVLDVYLARVVSAADPVLREHDAIRWVGPDDLLAIDWADADRPVLPALERHLRWLGAAETRA